MYKDSNLGPADCEHPDEHLLVRVCPGTYIGQELGTKPPGGRIFYHTYLFPLLKVQDLVEEVYLALRTKDGRDVPVLLNGARRQRGGRVVSDCVCLRMMQRHEYEDQLLQARRLAEESNAAKAKFLSMMSHDLRTPLTAIDGNAQLLAAGEYGPLTAEQLERACLEPPGALQQVGEKTISRSSTQVPPRASAAVASVVTWPLATSRTWR